MSWLSQSLLFQGGIHASELRFKLFLFIPSNKREFHSLNYAYHTLLSWIYWSTHANSASRTGNLYEVSFYKKSRPIAHLFCWFVPLKICSWDILEYPWPWSDGSWRSWSQTPFSLNLSKQPSVEQLHSPILCHSTPAEYPGWCKDKEIAIDLHQGCCDSTWSEILELWKQ